MDWGQAWSCSQSLIRGFKNCFTALGGSPFYLGRVDDEVKSTSRRTKTDDKERFLEFTEV